MLSFSHLCLHPLSTALSSFPVFIFCFLLARLSGVRLLKHFTKAFLPLLRLAIVFDQTIRCWQCNFSETDIFVYFLNKLQTTFMIFSRYYHILIEMKKVYTHTHTQAEWQRTFTKSCWQYQTQPNDCYLERIRKCRFSFSLTLFSQWYVSSLLFTIIFLVLWTDELASPE